MKGVHIMSFLQALLGLLDVEKINKRKLWKLMAALGLAVTSLLLLLLLLGQITVGAAPGENATITDARSASASLTLFQKSVDKPFAVPGDRRTYQIVFSSDQDAAMARLTDTLPSAVTWTGDISATNGSASHSDGTITWNGPLTTGVPVTITYDVKVTYGPCFGMAATDIYTDIYNDAVLDDGQGNVFTSTPAVFAIGRPFGTGSERTFDVDFGDADNDGDLDLAVGNHAPNQVCWNNGDGTFECEDAFGGSPTFDVDWGYMDNDGYLDLVVANSIGHANLVCLNNGDRTFTCTGFSTCPGGGQACRTALGDVDDDDCLDIALGIWQRQDLIYFNACDGTFPITTTTCTDYGWNRDLEFGDVDNDNDLDLVVVGDSPDYVCINNGGTFTETCWLQWRQDSTRSGALGDADGDGDLDIAAGEDTLHPIEIYLNKGDCDFETLLIGPAWYNTQALAWGDVDNDGDEDLAAGNKDWHNVIYFNEPTATDSVTFTNPIFLSYNGGVAFGDVDGDGDLDLAVGSDGGQNVVYLNTLTMTCVNYLPMIMKNYPTP
jgi:uncharacterized repeat protein (TIGR01451 family)